MFGSKNISRPSTVVLMYFPINRFFDVIFEDKDGQLNIGEFGLMMKIYWLMKVPGLKFQEFLVGPEREKWENLYKEFNERQNKPRKKDSGGTAQLGERSIEIVTKNTFNLCPVKIKLFRNSAFLTFQNHIFR